jgi:hypothetical protein
MGQIVHMVTCVGNMSRACHRDVIVIAFPGLLTKLSIIPTLGILDPLSSAHSHAALEAPDANPLCFLDTLGHKGTVCPPPGFF